MNNPTFTREQIEDWRAFEEVRSSGAYNMFDPRAMKCAGLSKDQYLFVMHNYSALKDAATKEDGK